jgi:hypothetical protein
MFEFSFIYLYIYRVLLAPQIFLWMITTLSTSQNRVEKFTQKNHYFVIRKRWAELSAIIEFSLLSLDRRPRQQSKSNPSNLVG